MWSCALAILAVASLANGDESRGAGDRLTSYLEPRLAASAMRIGRIERELGELKNRIAEASKIDPEGFVNDLNARMDHIEDTRDHCESTKEIRCGRDSVECVNTLLLCDGVNDCHNGWDESEKTCSAGPVKAGNVFSGTANWGTCRNRKDHPVKITIIGVYKSAYFGPRLGVAARVSADFVEDHDEEPHEFDVRGGYVYGKKRLALFPTKEHEGHTHLSLFCDFDHGNDKDADCVLSNDPTQDPCAKLRVSLEHHCDRSLSVVTRQAKLWWSNNWLALFVIFVYVFIFVAVPTVI